MQDYLTFGLEFKPLKHLISLLKNADFNCIRLEFSAEMVQKNPVVRQELLRPNPQLIGKTAIEIYQIIVKELTDNGLMVILDYHMLDAGWCCDPFDENGLWYNSRWPEDQVIEMLSRMVEINKNNSMVIGVDIRNEIRPIIKFTYFLGHKFFDPINSHHPTWGTGLKSDWAGAAERFGNKVLEINPNLLVFIQGMFILEPRDIKIITKGAIPKFPQTLKDVARKPLQLIVPNKLVYSAHDYVWHYNVDDWEKFTYEDYKKEAEKNWGFITKDYPLFLGEFGAHLFNIRNQSYKRRA